MAKYSPGGILLLGIGAFLVAIGWTDRLTAVWTALVSGQTDANASGLTPGSPGAAALTPGTRPDVLLSWANGKLYSPGPTDACKSGYIAAVVKGGSGDGANICFAAGDSSIAKWDDGNPATCQLWDHAVTHNGKALCFQPPPNNDWTARPPTQSSPTSTPTGTQQITGGIPSAAGQASTDNYILLPTGVFVRKSTPSARVF